MILRFAILMLAAAGLLCAQPANEDSVRNAVDAYKRMWNAMSPEQRKTMVDAGGVTPERYEQTMRMQLTGNAPQPTPASVKDRESRTDMGDAVRSSAEDRNTVRDANLVRLREANCPPEIALEAAAMRSRLAPSVMPPSSALLSLADNWFKRPPDAPANLLQASPPQPVDALLGIAPTTPKPIERARLNSEIERLLGACKP